MDRQASIRGWNVLIAIGLGLLVSGLLAFFRCPISAPAVWQPLSEAIGLIPPDDPMPGLWRMVVAGLAKWVGVGSIDAALMWCGHVAVGIVTACIYLIFCNVVLHLEQLAIRHRVNWSRRLLCILSGIGTLLVAFSEPMWRMGQTFLPETLELLMTLPAVLLFVMFLRTGRVVHAGLAVAFCGVLAGETVVGLVLGLFVLAGTYFSAFLNGEAKFTFANLVIRFIAMWRLIGAFLLGFVLMLTANCVAFSDAGGLEAHGWKSVDLMIRMFHLYGMQVVSAATPIAWFVAVFAVFVPFGVTLHLMKRAADDDKFLRYSDGLVILVCSLTAILQLLPFPTFWFWNWSVVHRQVSEYLLGLFATVNALTATFGFVVFCCEIYFRNVRRIAARRYPDDTEEEEAQRALESVVELRRALRWVFWSAMTLLLCVVAWRLPCTTARELLGVVDDYLDQVVDEAGDADVLFTDGRLDRGVELRAAARGKKLVALSFMEDNSVYHQKRRQRGGADQEDRDMLAFGAPDLLRTWTNAKPERLPSMATQIGLELWKRNGRTVPTCAGLLARTDGLDAQAVVSGRERAWALAERILALRRGKNDLDGNADRLLADMFLYIQWRVAWFCHMRSEQSDRANERELSEKEEALGTSLDEANPALRRMRQRASELAVWQTGRLTPREGLSLGLGRLDFLMARHYAQQVLQTDPDYAPANFAMGMSYLQEEQYNKAASYLRRCVEKDPNDISAWNNLAGIYQRQGSLDEALAAAERALEAAKALKTPEIRERAVKDVTRTLREIANLREKKGDGTGEGDARRETRDERAHGRDKRDPSR